MTRQETRDPARSDASPRRPWAVPIASSLTVVVGATTALAVTRFPDLPAVTTPREEMAFGVLGSSCEPERVAALHDAGVRFAELGVDWSLFEPNQQSFDRGHQSELLRTVSACRNAGIGVVLTLGLNSAPPWVSDLPAGAYINQDGDRGPAAVPNVVFSAAVRAAASRYLAELHRVIDLNSLAAIRVGTGNNGELGYPDAGIATSNSYWAFDSAAQHGTGLARGMSVSPMPGWTPGAATWRGTHVTSAEVGVWFRWYSASVADAVVWVVGELRSLGYTRDIHLPLAGRGTLPTDLEAALAAHLDGTDQRDGSPQAGLYYPEQLRRMSDALRESERPGWGTVSVDSTSVDDSSAVHARQLVPPQDSCRPDDATSNLVANPYVVNWSGFRWTVANARAVGFGVIGENPGPPEAPGTGSDDQTDSSEQQMRYAPRYARECGMTLFLWAFEDGLFSNRRAGLRTYSVQQRALGDRARGEYDEAAERGDDE